MKKKLLVGLLLAGSTMFAAPRFGFGVSFGTPAPVVATPPCPGPGYEFINGYWQFVGVHRDWDHDRDDYRRPERVQHFDRDRDHDRHDGDRFHR
ncbi:MAG TPA: hypothetical protein VFW44_07725 [Bryobacteraceae bacterium]|nr:hypothetical protein [Bryobacteraceae bacterium]